MAQASRDQNFVPTLLAVSSVDGTTPVAVYADPTTHRLLVDLPSGTGTVTSVSVTSANGFAGTVATATTTPAITISTTITGILKGNGTAISAVTIGSGLTFDGTTLSASGAGSGDVSGPASSTDNAIVRFDGATGKVIQNYTSGAPTISDTGAITATQGGSLTGTWTDLGSVTTIDINGGTIDGTVIGGASAAAITGTTITINTGLVPDANDGAYLGQAATAFSDLFLASGAVIGFANGDVLITHSSGTLTISDTAAGATGPILELYQDSASPVASDVVGEVAFYGEDGAGNKQKYAGIKGTITDTTSTAEYGTLDFAVMANGADTTKLTLGSSALYPTTTDTLALGNTIRQFSDLFLAEGGVINWDNGDATLTQVDDVVTLAGADLKVASPGNVSTSVVTTDATQTLTNKTLTSPTISTPSAFTTGGTITLAENTTIALDPAGSADGKYTGITVTGTAGYAQTYGDLVYLDPTDSRWEKTDANAASGADGDARGILGMVVVAGAADGNTCTLLLNGIIRADAAFPAFTINNPIYVSETAGAVTQTQPTTTDVVIRIVGAALTADEMYFNPDWAWITHT